MEIKINGIKYTINERMTIMKAAKEYAGITIPSLCYEERLGHITSCFLCCVEVEGKKNLIPACSSFITDGMSILTDSETVIKSRKTCLALLLSEHYGNCFSPCSLACPAGVDVQNYLKLAKEKKFAEAAAIIRENNPLPAICGRICVKFCEDKCRRALLDASISINAIKRSSVEKNSENVLNNCSKTLPKKGTAAVIGAGPAGLSFAWFSAKEGYDVTVFDAMEKPGGMLRYGIPSYRLPRTILNEEIAEIERLGVKFKTNTRIGKDISFDEIKKSFDKIFIGTGAWTPSPIGMENEKSKGVIDVVKFLIEVENKKITELSGTVIVIGGGNSAIDASRTALRLGAENVIIAYRRNREEMPAHIEEIEDAEKEGAQLLFLAAPKKVIVNEQGEATALEFLKTEIIASEAGKRTNVKIKPDSEFTIPANLIITATGQKCDLTFLNDYPDLIVNGKIKVNPINMATNLDGVYAGGDAVTGPATAIEAIAAGKTAVLGKSERYAACSSANLSQIELETTPKQDKRQQIKDFPVHLKGNFEETELTLGEAETVSEAGRCLQCGCQDEDTCQLKEYAVKYKVETTNEKSIIPQGSVLQKTKFIKFDSSKCILCQKCIRTCERASGLTIPGLFNRGSETKIAFEGGKALSESSCSSCGNCIDSCPTGALSDIDKTVSYYNKQATCVLCEGLCKVNLRYGPYGVYATSTRDKQTGKGDYLCEYGRYALKYLFDANRPLMNGKEVDFKKAVTAIGTIIDSTVLKYGRDSIGFFLSPTLTNEEIFTCVKLAKAIIGTDMVSSLSFLNPHGNIERNTLVKIHSTADIDNIEKSDLIFLVSGNTERTCYKAACSIREAVINGSRLVTIGKKEKTLDRFAAAHLDYDLPVNVINGLLQDEETARLFKERKTKITAICTSDSLDLAPALLRLLEKYDSVSGEGKGLLILGTGANSAGLIRLGAHPGFLPGSFEYSDKEAIRLYKTHWHLEEIPTPASADKIKTGIFVGEQPEKEQPKNLNNIIVISPQIEMNNANVYLPYALSSGTFTLSSGNKKISLNEADKEKTLIYALEKIASAINISKVKTTLLKDEFQNNIIRSDSILYIGFEFRNSKDFNPAAIKHNYRKDN